MDVSFFVARRFLRSKRNRGFISFITFFAVVGVSLGVAALVITLSILQGFERTIKENVVSFTAHMQIYGFQSQALQAPEDAVKKVTQRFPTVRVMTPYVSREAMILSGDAIDGILVKGIDPRNEISPAHRNLVEGIYDLEDRAGTTPSVVLGKRLAERLNVAVGDSVIIFALGGYSLTLSQTRVMRFVVKGLYETGMEEYDASFVYVPLASAQKLFQFGKYVSGFDVMVDDMEQLPALVQEIPAELGYPYYARTMFQMYRNLFAWVDLQKKQIPIILALIIVVATVNVVGTLLMMVMEKAKDIAVLQTLGAGRSIVSNVFLLQGMVIGVLGTVAGNILAYALCWLEMKYRLISLPSGIYYMTHVPIELSVWNFVLVSAAALVLCYLCSLIPSRFAARTDPVSLLRFAQ